MNHSLVPRYRRRRRLARRIPAIRARRGIALFVAIFMVVGIGALALSAIYLTANATLISKSYEKEDNLKYAAEAALAIGKASLNFNPDALPETSYAQLLDGKTLQAADGQEIGGIGVNLYLGPTGNTSGQFGTFASLVAEARDANGTGFVRRLELTQESFAKFAYWTNSEGVGILFGGGDQIWGPVWSNDDLNIASCGTPPCATFHDEVGTAGVINGAPRGAYDKGYEEHKRKILLPTLTKLARLQTLAAAGGLSLTAPTTGDETSVRMRLEFIAIDMNADHDSTDVNEGFFRVYTANAAQEKWLRGDWPGSALVMPDPDSLLTCGDWHAVGGAQKFFPWAVHRHPGLPGPTTNTWFDTVVGPSFPGGVAEAKAHGDSINTALRFRALLQKPLPRTCFLGGDPHLAAVARTVGLGYDLAHIHIGGEDTTFTPTDQFGAWTLYTATPAGPIVAARPADAGYLYPLYRGFNTGTKGVIYSSGTVGISGVVNGKITLYSPYTIVILDDLRYANDPAIGVCRDVMGIIAGNNTVIADNAINSPEATRTGVAPLYRSFDDTPDLYVHGVSMSLDSAYKVEHFDLGPTAAVPCGGSPHGRGCLYLTGGLIQKVRGKIATPSGTGFLKRYSYDRCAAVNPPPYFPTTGRFADNRYFELDPVRFKVDELFKLLTPTP